MSVDVQTVYLLSAGAERALEQLSTTTNNLANLNTPGFKRLVEEEFSQHVPLNGGDAYNALIFPRFKSTHVVLTEGPIRRTGNPLDLALKGQGFFAVKGPRGELYTRNGHFSINGSGVLVDANGNPVLDVSGKEIVVNGNGPVTVTPDGVVYEGGAEVGVLKVVNFDKVKPVGDSYYVGLGSPQATDAEVLQGYLELANVNPVKEMVNLIDAQRRFEIYGNLTRALAQLDLKTNEIGKV